MFDEAVDGLGPAPVFGDVVANQCGQEMSGECAFARSSMSLMREHGCRLRQGIPKDGLDADG